jgi:hypothetical protein
MWSRDEVLKGIYDEGNVQDASVYDRNRYLALEHLGFDDNEFLGLGQRANGSTMSSGQISKLLEDLAFDQFTTLQQDLDDFEVGAEDL